MKRILLSVFAAAITAAWAVPSDAADISFGGEYRLRGEYRANPNFQDGTSSQNFYDQRVRLTTTAKATEDTSVKLTLQDSRRWGAVTGSSADSGPALTDSEATEVRNMVDLHEAYLQVNNLIGQPVSLRAGRQELNYGDQRLIGAFGWNNNGRSFDALKFMYGSEMVDVDFWTAKIDDATTATTPNGAGGADNDQDFYGVYATVKSLPMGNVLDLYVLYLRDGSSTAMIGNGTTIGTITKPQGLWTYGARLKGAFQALDYTLEIPIQTGEIETSTTTVDISAYAYAVKAGYTLPTAMKIRIGAEYDYATGDDDLTNNEITTFSNLFPTNHDKLGFMDEQAWRNVKAWSVNAKADVNEKLSVYAAYWSFSLAEKADDWYGAGTWNFANALTFRNSNNSDSSVGSEIDVVATYKYNAALTAELGLSRFMSGDLLEANLPTNNEDSDWAYLQLTAKF